jgi:hypothetical protein
LKENQFRFAMLFPYQERAFAANDGILREFAQNHRMDRVSSGGYQEISP